jgi:hypothetical protein
MLSRICRPAGFAGSAGSVIPLDGASDLKSGITQMEIWRLITVAQSTGFEILETNTLKFIDD